MENPHPLKTLLQLQLASDSSAVVHLPYVLSTLTEQCLQPSSHTQKWNARVNSLIHSKDPAARWAGLCFALRTSEYSRALMMENASSWIGAALPLLAKNEAFPTIKACIRLLRHIFSQAISIPEFQRQMSTPNVPKFSPLLISLAEKHDDPELKMLALATLAHLIPLYPTLHRALHLQLSALALRFLNGATPTPTPAILAKAASQLYSILHLTGGKVSAANLWRKALDDTLTFTWSAFMQLRTTFPIIDGSLSLPLPGPSREDPVITIPLNVDRLNAGVQVIRDLLQTTASRPVSLPIGALVRLCKALLSCTPEEKNLEHVDSTVRSMELAVIPVILRLGCLLSESLAKCAPLGLTPHLSQLISYIAYHLEQQRPHTQHLPFLRAISSLLACGHTLHDSILPSRLARAILPFVTVILAASSDVQRDSIDQSAGSSRKKGKKRARAYEGDEIFKVSREVIFSTAEEGEVVIAALDAMQLVMLNPHLSPAVSSLAARVLLSIYISLPQMSPSCLSPDPSMQQRIYVRVQNICATLASGTASTLSKSLGLLISTSSCDSTGEDTSIIEREFELLLHPRVPPLVRSFPQLEALYLFRAEESQEEMAARIKLGLTALQGTDRPQSESDAVRENILNSPQILDSASPARVVEPTPVASSEKLQLHGPTKEALANSVPNVSIFSLDSIRMVHPIPPQTVPSQTLSAMSAPLSPVLSPFTADASSSSTALSVSAVGSSDPKTFKPSMVIKPTQTVQEDEDEPMPSIDMDSDSDQE